MQHFIPFTYRVAPKITYMHSKLFDLRWTHAPRVVVSNSIFSNNIQGRGKQEKGNKSYIAVVQSFTVRPREYFNPEGKCEDKEKLTRLEGRETRRRYICQSKGFQIYISQPGWVWDYFRLLPLWNVLPFYLDDYEVLSVSVTVTFGPPRCTWLDYIIHPLMMNYDLLLVRYLSICSLVRYSVSNWYTCTLKSILRTPSEGPRVKSQAM